MDMLKYIISDFRSIVKKKSKIFLFFLQYQSNKAFFRQKSASISENKGNQTDNRISVHNDSFFTKNFDFLVRIFEVYDQK